MSKAVRVPMRGVKGLFWEPDTYLDFVDFLTKNQFNYYMVGYTSFPQSSSLWRQPYSNKIADSIQGLSKLCNYHNIELSVAINPGISSQSWFNDLWESMSIFRSEKVSVSVVDSPIQYGNSDDRNLLWSKIKFLYDLGIRSFVLTLDDIVEDRWTSTDFSAMAYNHVNLLKFLDERLLELDSKNKLYFCPSTYTNRQAREQPEYLKIISEALPDNINIFWTGEEVVSVEFTKAQITTFCKAIGRKPIIWLNYPANDADYVGKLLMKPLNFDQQEGWENIAGLVVNTMIQAEPSKIVCATISLYLRNPAEYDPKKALDEVLQDLYSKDTAAWLEQFIQLYPGWEFVKCSPERIQRREITNKEIAVLTNRKNNLETMMLELMNNPELLNAPIGKELIIAYKRLSFFIDIYKEFMKYYRFPSESSRNKLLKKIQEQDSTVAVDALPIAKVLGTSNL